MGGGCFFGWCRVRLKRGAPTTRCTYWSRPRRHLDELSRGTEQAGQQRKAQSPADRPTPSTPTRQTKQLPAASAVSRIAERRPTGRSDDHSGACTAALVQRCLRQGTVRVKPVMPGARSATSRGERASWSDDWDKGQRNARHPIRDISSSARLRILRRRASLQRACQDANAP